MFAVIRTGGKQYLVKEGDVLQVEKLVGNAGDALQFEVMLKLDGDNIEIGKPTLSDLATGEILEQGRAPKVEVVKYKAKSRYTRRVGHRQPFTKVKMTKI